jgi:hypothetical protein
MSRSIAQTWHAHIAVLTLAVLAVVALSSPAKAQEVTKEAAAAIKAPYLADLEELKTKFVQLAEAFPDDKMAWRPMDGVRSVAEVLALIALELNGAVPQGFGGTAGMPREQVLALRTSTNKRELIGAINKAFDHAKGQVAAADPAALTVKRPGANGQQRSLFEFVLVIAGDMHEHLGQLISYARMNKIVPPWSR